MSREKMSLRELWASDKEDRDDFQDAAMFGASTALMVVGIVLSYPGSRAAFDRKTLPPVSSVVVGCVVFAGLAVWAWRSRSPLTLALALASIPLLVSGSAIRVADPDPSWASPVRAVGLALVIAVALAHSFVRGLRQRELEKTVFNDATAVTFFLTVVVASVVGVLDSAFDLPALSLLWVPLFANVTWFAALIVVERRYR